MAGKLPKKLLMAFTPDIIRKQELYLERDVYYIWMRENYV